MGIVNENDIFKANNLLPARQNMNNFEQILNNPPLLIKYKTIVVLNTLDDGQEILKRYSMQKKIQKQMQHISFQQAIFHENNKVLIDYLLFHRCFNVNFTMLKNKLPW